MAALTQAIAAAKVQSVARLYPEGISLISIGRPTLLDISIQNRDNKTVYFWHGTLYESLAAQEAGTALPEDPATWTGPQTIAAIAFVTAYGEAILSGQSLAPKIAQRGVLYSLVPAGTAAAHVKYASGVLEAQQ